MGYLGNAQLRAWWNVVLGWMNAEK